MLRLVKITIISSNGGEFQSYRQSQEVDTNDGCYGTYGVFAVSHRNSPLLSLL